MLFLRSINNLNAIKNNDFAYGVSYHSPMTLTQPYSHPQPSPTPTPRTACSVLGVSSKVNCLEKLDIEYAGGWGTGGGGVRNNIHRCLKDRKQDTSQHMTDKDLKQLLPCTCTHFCTPFIHKHSRYFFLNVLYCRT